MFSPKLDDFWLVCCVKSQNNVCLGFPAENENVPNTEPRFNTYGLGTHVYPNTTNENVTIISIELNLVGSVL